MNLPTTAKNLQPEMWQQVMRLIHPDNVEETLRILHAHQPMVDALVRCHAVILTASGHDSPHDLNAIEGQVADILNKEDIATYQHPWPPEPEPEPELEVTEPARA